MSQDEINALGKDISERRSRRNCCLAEAQIPAETWKEVEYKFESVYAELSAKRECIAKNTGAPEALVRFEYSKNGWIPVVVRPRDANGKKNGGASAAGALIPGSVEINNDEKGGELTRRDEGNYINGGSESISISGFDERSPSLVMQSSSRLLKIMAFGFLGLSTILWMRRPGVSVAAAMAMAVGGVMYIKNFIVSRVSYFTTLFRNPNTSKSGGSIEEIAEQKDLYKLSRRNPRLGLIMSAPSSPLRAHLQSNDFSASVSPRPAKQKTIDPEHKQYHQSKAKNFRRVVSMENRPTTRIASPRGLDNFCMRRTGPAMVDDGSVGGTVMIITVLCLVFYGRLCAIFFTSAWLYLLPMLVNQRMTRNIDSRMVDLESNEYKMKVIMDGLLERKHN